MNGEKYHYSPEAVEIDIAASLVEQFSDLSVELDKQRLKPEVRVSQYEFSDECSLYDYPAIVRDYIELFAVTVDQISVTIDKTKDLRADITIRINISSGSTLEISASSKIPVSGDFQLIISGPNLTQLQNKYTISPNDVGQLLISMALRPTDASEIDRARSDYNQQVVYLNPRDDQVLELIENSLENQATGYTITQKFIKEIFTQNDDDPTDFNKTEFTLVSMKDSDGRTVFDAFAHSHRIEKGEVYSYDISTQCGENQVLSQGTHTHITEDETRHVVLDRATTTIYMSQLVEALSQNRFNSPNTRT